VRGSADPIGVIEAGYDLTGTDREWLERVTLALRPLLDGGHGVHAYMYDHAKPLDEWPDELVLVDADPERVQAAFDLGHAIDPDVLRRIHIDQEPLASPNESLRKAGIDLLPAWHTHSAQWDVADYLALRTNEPGGRGVVVIGAQRRQVDVDRRTRRLWARVAAHLAAARRMRARLGDGSDDTVTDEAILTPAGRVAHAEGDARAGAARGALRHAVRQQERSRGRARRQDPEAATEAWTALVTGRWSLVDRFESDGRRYLVARPNEVRVPDPRALTERERVIAHLAALGKTNKLIAYELGLSPSTVATHLATALRKLGLRSRTQLVATLAGMGSEGREGVRAQTRPGSP
jgi:DNA-binding CsgD family transcriptional regulator